MKMFDPVIDPQRAAYKNKLEACFKLQIPKSNLTNFCIVQKLNYFSFYRWLNGITQGSPDLNEKLYQMIDKYVTTSSPNQSS